MTNVLDDAQVLDPPEITLDPPELGPALLLPLDLGPPPAVPGTAVDQSLLVFAPAPTLPTATADRMVIAVVRPLPADLPAPLVRPRRRFQTDWCEAAVITLMLGCTALGAFRLLWAIQP